MKYDKFMEILTSIPGLTWQLIEGAIRTEREICPICAVANHVLETDLYDTNYRKAAQAIDLKETLADD